VSTLISEPQRCSSNGVRWQSTTDVSLKEIDGDNSSANIVKSDDLNMGVELIAGTSCLYQTF